MGTWDLIGRRQTFGGDNLRFVGRFLDWLSPPRIVGPRVTHRMALRGVTCHFGQIGPSESGGAAGEIVGLMDFIPIDLRWRVTEEDARARRFSSKKSWQ